MKRTVLLAAASLLLACNLNAQWGKRIKGSGNEVTEERSVGSYSGWGSRRSVADSGYRTRGVRDVVGSRPAGAR